MIIKNVTNKIVHINGKSLMPDASASFPVEIANLPSVKALARAGILTVENEAKQRKPADPGKKAADDAAKKAAEEAAAKQALESKQPDTQE